MARLIYLSYGSGPHVQEVKFSLLSAIHCNGGDLEGLNPVIFTDTPEEFSGLGAEIEILSAEQMRLWAGPGGFGLRRKILAMQEALHRFEEPCLLVDGDTYFLKSPRDVFKRVIPGQSVMHVMEGAVGRLWAVGHARHSFDGLVIKIEEGETYEFTLDTPMWNSGVVGIHPADSDLLDEVIELCDGLHARVPTWISEQLAFSTVLRRRTKVVAAKRLIFHFVRRDIRNPFRERLSGLLEQSAQLPVREQAATLYQHCPRASLFGRSKAYFKGALKPFGFYSYDLETNV